MLRDLKHTLVAQVTAMILVILVIGQGSLYTWLLLYQKTYLEESLRREMTAIAMQIADTALQQGTDHPSLRPFLDLAVKTGRVLSVRIVEGNKPTLVAGTAPAEQGRLSPLRLFFIPPVNTVRVPLLTNNGIGAVEVTYSGGPVNDVMGRFLVIPPILQTITFLVVISAIVLFFRRKVSSPVASINATLNRITEGDLVAEVPEVAGAELGSIATGVKFLAKKLSTTLTRINILSNDVASALERLTAALEAVRNSTRTQTTAIDGVMSVIRNANAQQLSSTEGTDRLSRASDDNVSSLLEMKAAAGEIAASTERLFRSAEDAHAMIAAMSLTSATIATSSGEVYHAMENTSASVEEIGASLASIRENAARSTEFSSQVRKLLSERGTLAVADAIDAMEQIAEEVDHVEKIVSSLDEQSQDIENILSVIEDVTDSTKLLSLNAAILAAQAGEEGRGFSVVAAEIRSLSEGTAASAKNIAEIVKKIRSRIQDAVNATHVGVKKVGVGTELIAKSGEAMGETLEAAQKTAQMTTVVEKATEEQAAGLQQIRIAVENVRLMLEQVAKSTDDERRSADRMLGSIGEVKEEAGLVRKGANEQAVGTQVISRNLEESRDMVNQISQAARDQLKANEEIVAAVEKIRRDGLAALRNLEEMNQSFGALRNEVEDLKNEMAVFRTKSSTR